MRISYYTAHSEYNSCNIYFHILVSYTTCSQKREPGPKPPYFLGIT